ERADRQRRIRPRGDGILVEEDVVLRFEPGAGDDLDEFETQGNGRVRARGLLGEGSEGLPPVGGDGSTGLRHPAILSFCADMVAGDPRVCLLWKRSSNRES